MSANNFALFALFCSFESKPQTRMNKGVESNNYIFCSFCSYFDVFFFSSRFLCFFAREGQREQKSKNTQKIAQAIDNKEKYLCSSGSKKEQRRAKNE